MKPTPVNTAEQSTLPRHVALALILDPQFSQCIEESLKTEELVEQFERVYGVSRPRQSRNGMEAIVDKATGYTDDQYRKFFSAFIPFVYDCVYVRLLERPILPEAK
ncbi:MAG: hypothetical protein ACTINL_03690 [Serratia proteamaculans]